MEKGRKHFVHVTHKRQMTMDEVENLRPELGASLYLLKDKVQRDDAIKYHFDYEADKLHKARKQNAILRT